MSERNRDDSLPGETQASLFDKPKGGDILLGGEKTNVLGEKGGDVLSELGRTTRGMVRTLHHQGGPSLLDEAQGKKALIAEGLTPEEADKVAYLEENGGLGSDQKIAQIKQAAKQRKDAEEAAKKALWEKMEAAAKQFLAEAAKDKIAAQAKEEGNNKVSYTDMIRAFENANVDLKHTYKVCTENTTLADARSQALAGNYNDPLPFPVLTRNDMDKVTRAFNHGEVNFLMIDDSRLPDPQAVPRLIGTSKVSLRASKHLAGQDQKKLIDNALCNPEYDDDNKPTTPAHRNWRERRDTLSSMAHEEIGTRLIAFKVEEFTPYTKRMGNLQHGIAMLGANNRTLPTLGTLGRLFKFLRESNPEQFKNFIKSHLKNTHSKTVQFLCNNFGPGGEPFTLEVNEDLSIMIIRNPAAIYDVDNLAILPVLQVTSLE